MRRTSPPIYGQKKQEPSAYADASFMDDPELKEEGKKWIRHYGCAGCHEISGFEDEGRIGTELTYEGSKPIERLDFALFTDIAQRGGRSNRSAIRKTCALAGRPREGSVVRPQGLLRAQTRGANVYDKGKIKSETEKLRMPNLHLARNRFSALTTFLLGSQESSLPASYQYFPATTARYPGRLVDCQKYNCMGCHQFSRSEDI